MKMKSRAFFLFKIIIFSFVFINLFSTPVSAQVQDNEFSGNKKSSYQCFNNLTGEREEPSDVRDSSNYWLCRCSNDYDGNGVGDDPDENTYKCGNPSDRCEANDRPGDPGCFAKRAVLKPPTLQQVEIWFLRIVYVIWALAGSFSFFFLVVLGYRYLISRGDVTKITEIRQKIIYYFAGLALIFLAVPILTTFFNLLGINEDVPCYDVNMPGFQFFYTDLCTDPDGANPCAIDNATGKICNQGADPVICEAFGVRLENICYACVPTASPGGEYFSWQRSFGAACQ